MNTLTKFVVTAVAALNITGAAAQQKNNGNETVKQKMNTDKPEFKVFKSDDNEEITYKGLFSYRDMAKEPSFTWLTQGITDYEPDVAVLDILRKNLRNYRMFIFLGTWCEDSQEMIPELYKVLSKANIDYKNIQVVGLDREKTTLTDTGKELVRKYEISLLPTIVLVDKSGNEKGRITETTTNSVEEDLAEIINDGK